MFIVVTNNGKKIVVNIDHITYIEAGPNGRGTTIHTRFEINEGWSFVVSETFTEVQRALGVR